jgi:putative transposase
MRPNRESTQSCGCAYFVTTQAIEQKPLFRDERWAQMIVATLTHYGEQHFTLHAFVVMPDHVHFLITPSETVENAAQLIKGGFSFLAERELGWNVEVWEPGFKCHPIRDEADWKRHLEYIRLSPVEGRLSKDSTLYPYIGFPQVEFPQRSNPAGFGDRPAGIGERNVHSEVPAPQSGIRGDWHED